MHRLLHHGLPELVNNINPVVKGRAFAAEVDPRAKPGAPAAVEFPLSARVLPSFPWF